MTGVANPVPAAAVMERLQNIINAQRKVKGIDGSSSLRDDVNLDSLALLELLTAVEDEFSISLIDHPDIYSAKTVEDLARMVESLAGEQNS